MKRAIVTGCTSGIGREICLKLMEAGYFVYGIGRDFSKISEIVNNSLFHACECDLKRHEQVENCIKEIKALIPKDEYVELLVNNAGVGYFGPHEQLKPSKIHELVAVNLEAPMIITSMLLRDLKKCEGTIINISSVTAKKSNTHGCAYGASKAGLTSFGESLFDEVRKYGVRVVNVHPDMTKSNFYRNADFRQGDSEDTYLEAVEVAEQVMEIITIRKGIVITDITIKPQKHQIVRK